ncbi:glycosyl hydrolase [Nocardioides glacieisoli]|uniref:Glycosyl hydrolase n=1 Tax=Nocardioides glacieisoli TaxID=1168730 RepID=A0A4Q2RMQ0_9ACTN|nr:beta-galactosidase [Nocardioides glacieisoli]RYB89798.1 glycosyl hydrolase [Nocardioides glacieisoli]
MIEVRDKQIVIDGEPRLVMAGEVHYFRVARDEWEQRLDLVVEAGCTAVASYIPWLFHELPDGSIDVTGATRPERDVAAFVDLCAERGLWFIARPGPFVMAELKNEGIPYRVYDEHPEVVPVGWDGREAPSRTVDYLAPAFLAETARWYDAILPVLAPRLQPRGGNIIGVQLDNEVGMLAWVTNSPDLTDHLLADLGRWVTEHRGTDHYPVGPDDAGWADLVRSPDESVAGRLRVDLGLFMRERFAAYVVALRELCEARDVRDVPFLVNIHGTESGSGAPFPIGISQLVSTYSGVPGMVSGSDHYLGAATSDTLTDVYVMNAFMDAVHDEHQPLTSLEFEAGTGDYSGGIESQHDPSTVELKTRLCVAQGNRLVNYYLLAGGINPPLEEAVGDGNDRLSFTGERHGTAAPIGPEGQRGFAYDATARTARAMTAQQEWLSRMTEEHDDVALGLVLDAYATEYHHPDSDLMTEVVDDLAGHRGAGQRRFLPRSLLLAGFRFGAVHLEERDPAPGSVLALATGRFLSAEVQQRVLDHVRAGGGLLLLGRLPERDLEGEPCTVLADGLGVRGGGFVHDNQHFFPSVVRHGWAAPGPEVRVGWRQEIDAPDGEVVLTDVDGAVCGVSVTAGSGRAVLLTAGLPSDPTLVERAMAHLGTRAAVYVDAPWPGVLATTTATADGQRAVHLINHSAVDMDVTLTIDGVDLPDGGALRLPGRSGHVLPLGLDVAGRRVLWASAEVTDHSPDHLDLAPGLDREGRTTVLLAAGTPVAEHPSYAVDEGPGGRVRVTGGPGALSLRFG